MSYKLYKDNGNFKIRKDGESFLIGDNLILSPTPTTTPTPTPTTTVTPTISITPTITSTQTSTPTISVTATVTATPTPTSTPTLTITATPTYTPGASSTPTSTITVTPTSSAPPTPTPSTSSIISIFKTSNTANYSNCASWDSLGGNITTVGSNGNSSTYGIYDMAGGIYEWTERIWFSSNRGLKGGTWTSDSTRLNRSFEAYQPPTFTSNLVGFRVATIASSPYIEYGIVGDINNENDSAGIGNVSYEFKMGKFEITNTEYVEFLNSIAVTDTYGAYSTLMNDPRGGVLRSGSNGSYVYAIKTNYQNKPAICVNWYNAARYCNWLQNGKPSGIQDNTTTENGAYQLTGNTGFPTREFGATYFIPNGNEWQKAAFYKGGSTTAGYWDYATQSNTAPTCISANSVGDGIL